MKKKLGITLLVLWVVFSSFVSQVSAADPPENTNQNTSQQQDGQQQQNQQQDPQQEGFNLIFDKLVVFPTDRIEAAKDNGYEPKFGKYPPSRYYLEIQFQDRSVWELGDAFADQGYLMLHGIMNLFWQALLVWDFMVVMAVEQAFALDIVNKVADEVEVVIRGLAGFNGTTIGNTGIWGNFFFLTIICAGAWIAYNGLYKRNTTSAWSAIISTLFIMMAAFAFFANSSGIMKYLNTVSSDISQELMGVGLDISDSTERETDSDNLNKNILRENSGKEVSQEKKVYSSKVTSMMSADKVYEMLIYEPYLMLQYGKTSKDSELSKPLIEGKEYDRVEHLLEQKVGSDERNKLIRLEKTGNTVTGVAPNPMFTSAGLFQRMGMLFLLYIAHFLIGAILIGISLAMIVYQFFFVIFALFAPFALLLSLYPAWNGIAANWVKGFIGYQLKKILLGVLLSVILTISQMLYQMASPDEVGYAWTIVLQLALMLGLFWKRNELMGMLDSSVGKISDFYNNDNRAKIINYISKSTEKVKKSKVAVPRK